MTDDQNMPCLVEITDGKSSEYCLNLAEKFSGKAGFRYAPQYDKEVSVGYIFEHERDFVVSLLRARAILSSDPGGDRWQHEALDTLRESYAALSLAFNRLHGSARTRDGEMCDYFGKVRGRIEAVVKSSALPSPATISSGSAK